MNKVQIIKAVQSFIPEKLKVRILQSLSVTEKLDLLSQVNWNREYILGVVRALSDEEKINVLIF